MKGQIVIGEGALDEAPLLYTGEFLGTKNGPLFKSILGTKMVLRRHRLK